MALIAAGFAPVQKAFEAALADDPTYSAQLCVHHRGVPVVDLTVGDGLQPDSLLPVFSSSKGASAVVVALLVERGQLDLNARVASYWPEFAARGKAEVTVRQLLSHQAGLPGVDGGYTVEELLAHTPLAERLAAQRPLWAPGTAYLYHGITIGTLADELVRRIDGRPLRQVLHEDVLDPRGIDLWMGTPAEQDGRVAPVIMPTFEDLMASVADAGVTVETDGIGTVSAPVGGALALLGSVNEEFFRRVGVPAAGMLATARGLAALYAAVHHEVNGRPRLLGDDTVAQMAQTQVYGLEYGTGLTAAFGVMFQRPVSPRWPFGSYRAFGHDGAGGSLAFSDPEHDVSFGYLVQRIPLPGGMDPRAVALTRVVRECVAGLVA